MCTTDVNVLADPFQVNFTKNTATFTLHASSVFTACQAEGPIPFCLVPPRTRLQTMCAAPLTPFFDAVLGGSMKTLNDLPLVWDAPFGGTESDPAWLTRPESPNQFSTSADYIGLEPMPVWNSVAVANDYAQLWGMFGGDLWQLDDSGFLEASTTVQGQDTEWQSVVINGAGTMGCVMFTDKLFFYQNGAFTDVTQSTPVTQYLNIKLYNANNDGLTHLLVTGLIFTASVPTGFMTWHYSGSTTFTLVRQNTVNIVGNFTVLWVGLTNNAQNALVAVQLAASVNYDVWILNQLNNATLPVDFWNVPPGAALTGGAWETVIRGDVGSTIQILTLARRMSTLFLITLPAGGGLAPTPLTLISNGTCLVESMPRDAYLWSDTSNNVFFGTTNFTMTQVANTASFGSPVGVSLRRLALSGDEAHAYAFFDNHQFFESTQYNLPNGTWTHSYDIFTNQDAHISDFGIIDLLPVPQITWFFGFFTVSFVKAGDILVSPHQYYRTVVDSTPTSGPGMFTHISAILQQANMPAILRLGSTQFANNTELRVQTNNITVWHRSTQDAFNAETPITIVNPDSLFSQLPYVSRNGLYILFVDGTNVKMAFNVYNSPAFTAYCTGKERISRALNRQETFCWEQLFDETTGTFADGRCTCIAGPQMVDLAFPDRVFPPLTRARLEQNLPCVLKTCQDNLSQPEATIVYNAVKQNCKNNPLTVCSSLVVQQNGSKLKLTNGSVIQTCGTNLLGCSQDQDCPLGTTCTFGRCLPNCTVNSDCIFGSTCESGVCVNPQPFTPAKNQSSVSLAFVIVIASFAALALMGLLLVLLLPK